MNLNTIDIESNSEAVTNYIKEHSKKLQKVLNQLDQIENEVDKLDLKTTAGYQQHSKADYYLLLNEIDDVLPLLTDVLHNQLQTLKTALDISKEIYEEVKGNEAAEIKKTNDRALSLI